MPQEVIRRCCVAGIQMSFRERAMRQASMEVFTCSLARISWRWRLTVWMLMLSRAAIVRLFIPVSINESICRSRGVRMRMSDPKSSSSAVPAIESTTMLFPLKSTASGS